VRARRRICWILALLVVGSVLPAEAARRGAMRNRPGALPWRRLVVLGLTTFEVSRLVAASMPRGPGQYDPILPSAQAVIQRETTSVRPGAAVVPADLPRLPAVVALVTPASMNVPAPGTSRPATRRFASGEQMYQARRAALAAGAIYPRLPEEAAATPSRPGQPPTHEDWQALLAEEAAAMARTQGQQPLRVMLGDSLTTWFPPEWLPGDTLWLNQAISGDTSTGVLERLAVLSGTRPAVVYVMAGVNDVKTGVSDEQILANHRQIVRTLRQTHPAARVVVQSILPVQQERWPAISGTRIEHINEQLALIARAEGATYLDLHGSFVDGSGELRSELSTDGLHLGPEGYWLWRSALERLQVDTAAR
jgi:lysophospholipase L1-like esterase